MFENNDSSAFRTDGRASGNWSKALGLSGTGGSGEGQLAAAQDRENYPAKGDVESDTSFLAGEGWNLAKQVVKTAFTGEEYPDHMKDMLERYDTWNKGKTYRRTGEDFDRTFGDKYGLKKGFENFWHGFNPGDDINWTMSGKADHAFLSVMAPILRNSLVMPGPLNVRPDFATIQRATHAGSKHLGPSQFFMDRLRDPETGEHTAWSSVLAPWRSPFANYAMWSMGGQQAMGGIKGVQAALGKIKAAVPFFSKVPLPALMKQWFSITPKAVMGQAGDDVFKTIFGKGAAKKAVSPIKDISKLPKSLPGQTVKQMVKTDSSKLKNDSLAQIIKMARERIFGGKGTLTLKETVKRTGAKTDAGARDIIKRAGQVGDDVLDDILNSGGNLEGTGLSRNVLEQIFNAVKNAIDPKYMSGLLAVGSLPAVTGGDAPYGGGLNPWAMSDEGRLEQQEQIQDLVQRRLQE